MNLWQYYHCATSVADALAALAEAPGSALIISGGTDLLLDLQQGRHAPVHTLVDVTKIPEMSRLETRPGGLFVGAAVPINQVVRSPLVQEHGQALVEAADLIGGPQVRNTATLGGNVAHALPAADGAIALAALDAQVEIASLAGRRLAPLLDLYAGPGKSRLDPHRELLVGFHLPLRQPGQASAFQRVMRPQGVALPILNLAAWVERRADQIAGVRVAIGPAGPVPQRARRLEAALPGRPLDQAALAEALTLLLEEMHFRTSPQRATAGYRRQLAGVLLNNVLTCAWQRAAQPVSLPAA